MPEIMRSSSQGVMADLHKPAAPKNLPSHYELLLITQGAALRQASHLHGRKQGAADRGLDARPAGQQHP
jgi:hypothetical protein